MTKSLGHLKFLRIDKFTSANMGIAASVAGRCNLRL